MSGLSKSTDETFEQLKKSAQVVIFKMSATWCNPCVIQSKTCLEYMEKNPEVKIYDHDIEKSPNFPTSLGTRGLPTCYLFVNSELKGQLVGSVPLSRFSEFVKENVPA